MGAWLRRARLTLETARYLRSGQITNRVWRRLWNPRAVQGAAPAPRIPQRPWIAAPARRPEWHDAVSVTILAETACVRQASDWQRAFDTELRRYHLHYLDQLCATIQPAEAFPSSLLDRWIRDNPPGSSPGWDPYPTSRRIVNAFKATLGGMALSETARASLADQCRYLIPRIEMHLLGNHVLANAKALLFAGSCLGGAEAGRWLKLGRQLLAVQVNEQILADGGHVERSPMYHAIVTEDLLDLVNLRNAYELAGLEFLDPACTWALAWLGVMCHPDGGIPLVNDSVLDGACSPAVLEAYAKQLGVSPAASPQVPLTLLRASGFARLAMGQWCLLAEVGGVAPPYQPGHAHAGTLGYELSVGRDRVVVDTGVSTYSADDVRAQERGTAAHNTVTIDERNSSEVWSAFRVARRARVTGLNGGAAADFAWLRAAHDGYRSAWHGVWHERRWRMSAKTLEIEDTLRGRGAPTVAAAVHFHPECRVELVGPFEAAVTTPSGMSLRLQLDPAFGWRFESYLYAPNFGVRLPAVVLRGRAVAQLPQSARMCFELGSAAE